MSLRASAASTAWITFAMNDEIAIRLSDGMPLTSAVPSSFHTSAAPATGVGRSVRTSDSDTGTRMARTLSA